MAQLVISAAGAAVGFYLGGPNGAQVGWAVGAAIGSQFGPKQRSQGPRLEDLRITGSEYGQTIPWVAGHPRLAGQVWWASERREIATTTSAGKGGGGAESTSYTYEVDLLMGLTNNVIPGVTRIWSNGKLVYSALAGSSSETAAASGDSPLWERLTVYTGGSSQLPDPTYEAAVANAPAYRGRGSVFIEGLQLGNSGVIPNLTFEISPGGLDGFEFLGAAETSGLGSAALPDHQADDLLVLFCKDVSGSFPTARAGFTTPAGGTFGTGPKFRIQWARFEDSAPTFLGSYVNEVTLALVFRGASIVGPVLSLGDSVPVSSISAPVLSTQTSGGGYVLQYGSVNSGALLWAGYGEVLHDQSTGLGGGDSMVTWTGERTAASGASLFSRSPAAAAFMAAASVELAPVFIGTGTLQTRTLQEVVEDLCQSSMPAGTYDAAALTSITKPVRAFALSQVATTRSAIEQLMAAYFFEAFASDKLYFVPRSGIVRRTIDADDMGAGLETPDDETLPTQVGSELELQAQVSLSYSNVDADYTIATEHSDRLLSGQISTSAVQLPFGFTSAEAKGISDAIVLDAYASRVSGRFSVPLGYAELTPTDVVSVPDADGNVYRVRLVRRSDTGQLLQFDWVLDDATAIESAGITSDDYTPAVDVALPGATIIELLDIPLLRDSENTLGHYVAATSAAASWPGASISRSLDNVEFSEAARVNERATLGAATTELGSWSGGEVFDEINTVTVSLSYGTLSSSTRDAMLADTSINAMMIGSELIRFRTATFVETNVYTLSGLLRGQKGTEWAITEHAVGDVAVLLTAAGMRYVAIDLPSLASSRYYKGVTIGRSIASAASEPFTCEGVSLKPLPPVMLRASVSVFTSDITFTWKRRTRLTTSFMGTAGAVVPLGEVTELYRVRIYSDAGYTTLKRELAATSESAAYTAAQQLADFSSLSATLYVALAQVSAVVGAGLEVKRAFSGLASSTASPSSGIAPYLFAGSASGWLAFSESYETSGTTGITDDLRVSSFWKAASRSGPFTLNRTVTTLTVEPENAVLFNTLQLGRIAQTATRVLTFEDTKFTRALLDLSSDPEVIEPSIAFASPRVLGTDGSRFILMGDTNLVHESTDGETWTLVGTMAGATFPHDVGAATYRTHGISLIAGRWFLTFGLDGSGGANANRLFYSDDADAQTGWVAATGITVGSLESLHEEVVFDGTYHYAAVTDFASTNTRIYTSSDNGASWTLEYTLPVSTGFEVATSGSTQPTVVHLQVTGTTGADYVRAYAANGVVFEKLVGTTSWSAKASGLENPFNPVSYNGAAAFTDLAPVYTSIGSRVVYETSGVVSPVSGF